MASSGLVILLFIGILLIIANAAVRKTSTHSPDGKPKVVYKYLPRDLDTYLRQDDSQPSVLYRSMFNDENIIR